MKEGGLASLEDLRGHDRGQLSRIATTSVIGLRAHRTHLDKAMQLHAFARHRDQTASIAYPIERAELVRARHKRAWPGQVGKRSHLWNVRRSEPLDRRAPRRRPEYLHHHLNAGRPALEYSPRGTSLSTACSRSNRSPRATSPAKAS